MALTAEVAQKSLRRLGRHPLTLQHALLEMDLTEKELNSIDVIAEFSNVMHLNLSNNFITSLSVLSDLPALVEINASHNHILECLDFIAPHCTHGSAWETGHRSPGSLLTVADQSNNHIDKLRDLSHHRFLEQLILHHNRISIIEGLTTLRFLQVLDLSYNSIAVIEGLDHLPIRDLKLRGNRIVQLFGLDKLPNLSRLDVAENQIISLSQLEKCTNLTHLDVSFNQIEYIRQCEYVKDIPWLVEFHMQGNPCARKEHYRLRVLFRLPRLVQLDSAVAELEDKVRAFNLYRSPLGDLAMREEVLRKRLPHVPFVDHSPQQLPHDEETDLPPEELLRGLPKSGNFVGGGGDSQGKVLVGEVTMGDEQQEVANKEQQSVPVGDCPTDYTVEAH